jgi:SNF2 family DNA or RNA helicase
MDAIQLGTKTLYPHQVRAVHWMLEREDDVDDLPGGFLCDTMGMGKTWSALGLIQESDLRRTLLLCPLAVVEQWADAGVEAGFNVWTYPRGGVWTAYTRVKPGRKRLYVANYERIKACESEDAAFDRLLMDEAHVLRTGSGSRYKKIYELAKRVPRVWCLTGTPLVNHYRDIQALYQLLRGQRKAGVVPNYDAALEVMENYGLHRSALTLPVAEVEALGLGPAPEEVRLVLPFETAAEAEFYRMIQGQIQRQLDLFEDMDIANSTAIFKLLLRLRQISIHPQVYIEGQRRSHGGAYGRRNWADAQGRLKGSTKVSALLGLLKMQKVAHNWVVFCNFQDEIRILEDALRREVCVGTVASYHGKKKMAERVDVLQENKEACAGNLTVPRFLVDRLPLPDDVCNIIHSFVVQKQNVFLVQIHAGGTGLNLQHNDRVVFMGPWWTSALMKQAVARVYRMGQRKVVKVYRLMLEEEQSLNIDRFMMDRAELKEERCAELLDACAHD